MKFWIFRLHPRSNEFRSKAKSVGQVVDQSLHRFFQRPEDNRSLDAIRSDFDLVWLQEKANVKDWCILPAEESFCHDDAWTILETFFENFDVTKTPVYIPPLNNVPNRFDLMIKLDLGPDLTIQGWGDRMDKIDGGYEVIDYKTKAGAELYEEKNNLQLRMYGLLFDLWLSQKSLPGQVTDLAFLYLTPRGVEKRSFKFTPEDKEQTTAEVKELQKKILSYWAEYGEKPWPCLCGRCSGLLSSMESRADEWAAATNAGPVQQPLLGKDIPF